MNNRSTAFRFVPQAAIAVLLASAGASAPVLAQQATVEKLRELVPDHIRQTGEIEVAGFYDNPPALYADVANPYQPIGLVPELADAVGELLGVEFVWNNIAWSGQLPGLDAGTYDVLWGQISVTEEREREILDVIPWNHSVLSFLTLKGNPSGFDDTWTSACGKTVAVSLGSTVGKVLQSASSKYCADAGFQPITVLEYQGSEDTAVRSGQAEAVMESHSVQAQTVAALPDVFEAIPLQRDLSLEFYPGMRGIGTKKADAGLALAIAGALQILYDTGEWQVLAEKHNSAFYVPDRSLVVVNPLTQTPAGTISK